jgi:hypothetical protein
MAITKEIEIKVNTSGAVKNVDNLNSSIKSTKKEVDQSSQATSGLMGSIDKMTGGAITKLKGLTSSLGAVAGGFRGIGAAIALSGLGLLLLTIAAVTAAFKSSEEGQNKFAKIMGVIGSVTGNLIDILSDFGELVISVFENPQKAIKDFANLIKENITNRLNGLLELIPNLGKAVKLLFEGNFSEAAKVAADATAKVTLGVNSISTSLENATNKTKEFIAELEREAKIAAQIADKRAQADTTERNLIVKRAEADEKIAILREKALLRDKFSASERIKFLKEASKIEEDITNQEIKTAILRRDAIIEENKLSKSNKEALKAEEEAKAKVIQLNTSRLQGQRRLTATIQSLQLEEQAIYKASTDAKKKQIEEEQKAKEEAIKKEIEDEKKRIKAIEDLQKTYAQKIEDLEDVTQLQKIARQEERALAELEALNATELEKYELKEYYAKLTEEELEKVAQVAREKNAAKDKEAAEQQLKFQESVEQAKYELFDNTTNLLSNLAKKGSDLAKGLAIANVVREQVEGVSKIISNTAVANAKAAAASPLTGGQPFVGINTAAAALGIAGSVAGAAKAIKDITSGSKSAQGGSLPSGGGGASAPSFNLVQGTGSNQIAESLATERQPIQAYVVASNVTSAQELDRNSVTEATV